MPTFSAFEKLCLQPSGLLALACTDLLMTYIQRLSTNDGLRVSSLWICYIQTGEVGSYVFVLALNTVLVLAAIAAVCRRHSLLLDCHFMLFACFASFTQVFD